MRVLLAVGLSFVILWALAAGVWPFFEYGFDLDAVQRVWHHWQAWNAGAAAAVAAVLAVIVARFIDESERRRAYEAALIMLPFKLSNILRYISDSQRFLVAVHAGFPRHPPQDGDHVPELPPLPEQLENYEASIAQAAKWGKGNFKRLMKVSFGNLQVYQSRLRELDSMARSGRAIRQRLLITDYIIQGAVLYIQFSWLLANVRDDEAIPTSMTARDIESGLRLTGIYTFDNFGIDDERLKRRASIESRDIRAPVGRRGRWGI